MPNLTDELSTEKEWRLNQFGAAETPSSTESVALFNIGAAYEGPFWSKSFLMFKNCTVINFLPVHHLSWTRCVFLITTQYRLFSACC